MHNLKMHGVTKAKADNVSKLIDTKLPKDFYMSIDHFYDLLRSYHQYIPISNRFPGLAFFHREPPSLEKIQSILNGPFEFIPSRLTLDKEPTQLLMNENARVAARPPNENILASLIDIHSRSLLGMGVLLARNARLH